HTQIPDLHPDPRFISRSQIHTPIPNPYPDPQIPNPHPDSSSRPVSQSPNPHNPKPQSPIPIPNPQSQSQIQTLGEARVLVRRPALELLSLLKGSDFTRPAVRYLIYGERGTGKSLSLSHVLHGCWRQGWLILHVPDAHAWVRSCRELLPSSHRRERLEQPLQASAWLRAFKSCNERFLTEVRGLSRVRSASDAVGVVLRELRQQCQRGSFRLLVAVDGVNALWGRTALRRDDGTPVRKGQLGTGWDLGVFCVDFGCILAVFWVGFGCIFAVFWVVFWPYPPDPSQEGFDALDPFVPIAVPNYSPREFESCYSYYLERRWLQHPNGQCWEGKGGEGREGRGGRGRREGRGGEA
uniref:Small ribosomal subunit protein mS29 n=1 Tax=Malurus cyaneus samueli TaxID=2593467 RepID=A0A8C5WZT3_9PASS